jgi:lysophospholipase L1-like esterase
MEPRSLSSIIVTSLLLACSLLPVSCASSPGHPNNDETAGSADLGGGSGSVAVGGGAGSDAGGAISAGGTAGWAGTSASGGAGTPESGGNSATAGTSNGGGGASNEGGARNAAGASGAGGGGAGSGGAGSGGAGSGGAGGASYDPCPAAGSPCVVLPFGDSITYGYGSTDLGGYRSALFALAVAGSKSLTFVGSSADGPSTVSGKPFPRQHEGHPGYTIAGSQGIAQFVQQGIIKTFKPNIVLLAIGTNDISQNIDLPNAPLRLGQLIDAILVDAPSALIVVAQITPSQKEPANTYTTAYDAALPAVVQQRVKQGKHVVLVDMNAPFVAQADWKKTLMTDSVHPNDAGYAILSRVWYGALASVLR